jgi:hypothetical protein
LAKGKQKAKEEMQEAKQSLGQYKIQMLGEETKSQCSYTEEEEKTRCLSKGISAGGLNNVFVA